MLKKVVTGVMLALLLTGSLMFAFNVRPVKGAWTGTIYIRADGSIEPPDAPIITYDNVTYTLTGNITSSADGIVVERDNIVIEGAGHTLQGTGSGSGIDLSGRSNVTIKNITITTFYYGIRLHFSSNNSIVGNNITNNVYGVWIYFSCNNSVSGNNITNNNSYGILVGYSSNNNISGNTFIEDGLTVAISYDNTVVDNLVNGKPLVYLEGDSDLAIEDAGQIILVDCNNILVENLNISHTDVGVELWSTNKTTIRRTNLTKNRCYGIWLYDSSNNNITESNMENNGYGIALFRFSNNNTVSENIITNNGIGIAIKPPSSNIISENYIENNGYGIYGYASNNVVYHNNFLDNGMQALVLYNSVGVWDDGYPSGGNYWNDYTGVDLYSGPHQNETGSDGIGDTPYVIDENNQDNYPFVNALSFSKHDVAVLDVEVSEDEFQAGSQINIYVTVKNKGDFNESNIDVKVYYDHTLIGTQTVAELNTGETVTLTFDWYTSSVDPGKYVIRAEAGSVPDEIICVNNVFWDGLVNVLPSSGGGACPFVYVWNSTAYVVDNNILPESEISDGDVEDYYRLEQALTPEQGKYQLVIGEFENEHSYFDVVKLLAVDHDEDIEVAVTSEGEILTYKDPSPPASAIDDQGDNVLKSIKEIDGQYYQGHNGSFIELDFGDLNVKKEAKLVLRTDQPPVKEPWSIHVQS
ncbi:hypothetical protein DRO59_09320 [Candidatus Bathyarchaeota archaeon]|nr:MAG: hypothetical protein DRO59_09320 [Candidatus Bathyarchaeota archaeon]